MSDIPQLDISLADAPLSVRVIDHLVTHNPVTTQLAIFRESNVLVEKAYILSEVEQKIVLMAFTQLCDSDKSNPECHFNLYYFSKALGFSYHRKDFTVWMTKILSTLLKRVLHFEPGSFPIKDDPRNKNEYYTHWVQAAELDLQKGEIILTIDEKLRPYLTDFSAGFTKYVLATVMSLSSFPAIRIFMYLYRMAFTLKYDKDYAMYTWKRRIDTHSLRLLCGIEDTKYKEYGVFKQQVLNKSVQDINKKTCVRITNVIEEKINRKVEYLIFVCTKQDVPGVASQQEIAAAPIPQLSSSSSILDEYCALYNFCTDSTKNTCDTFLSTYDTATLPFDIDPSLYDEQRFLKVAKLSTEEGRALLVKMREEARIAQSQES